MYNLSNTTEGIDKAFMFITVISVFLTIVITAVMLWFCFRYSRKRNPVASQIHGHMGLEITWTVIPILITLWMFQLGWDSYDEFRNDVPGAYQIDVWAQQFRWDFEYPNGKTTVSNLVLPAGKPVKLTLRSRDVNHSFFISQYSVKEDVIPGLENTLSFTPLKPGIYDIFCAEYCGLEHSSMLARLVIKDRKEFYEWLNTSEEQKPIVMAEVLAGSASQLSRGQVVYETNCASCHGPKGDGAPLKGKARNFNKLEGWTNGSSVTAIFRTLATGIKDTQMASFKHLPVDDRFAVLHYVQQFTGTKHPQDTAQALAKLDEEFSLSTGAAAAPEIPIGLAFSRTIADAKAGQLTTHGPSQESTTYTITLTDGIYR